MPRQQNWKWKCFNLFTIYASNTRKGLKCIQNILTDLEKASVLPLPEPGSFLPSREPGCSAQGAEGQCGICAVKPFQQSCALLKSQAGCALLAERLPGQQRGGAGKEKQIHFLPRFCFLRVQLQSERSPSQTHRRWIVQITHNLALLIYDSTTGDKEKNLKCSAPFKQEESPWWQARECLTCFSTTPRCTHTTLSSGNSSKNSAHRLWAVVCRRIKSPAPPPRVRRTDYKKPEPLWNISLANCCNFPSVFSSDDFAGSTGDDLQHLFWIKAS